MLSARVAIELLLPREGPTAGAIWIVGFASRTARVVWARRAAVCELCKEVGAAWSGSNLVHDRVGEFNVDPVADVNRVAGRHECLDDLALDEFDLDTLVVTIELPVDHES